MRRGETPDQPVLEVEGPIRPRTFSVDAPLVVAGEVRLPTRGLEAAAIRGGSLVRRADGVAVRFRLVLHGPARSSATIALAGSVRGAAFPRAVLTAEPSAAAVVATGASRASPQAAADAASRMLLGLARVRQYDAFLANPASGGAVHAVYSFRTVEPSTAAASPAAKDEGGGARPLVVLLLALVGAGGLAVLWAHL